MAHVVYDIEVKGDYYKISSENKTPLCEYFCPSQYAKDLRHIADDLEITVRLLRKQAEEQEEIAKKIPMSDHIKNGDLQKKQY